MLCYPCTLAHSNRAYRPFIHCVLLSRILSSMMAHNCYFGVVGIDSVSLSRRHCASTPSCILRDTAIGDPDINEGLHRFYILFAKKTKEFGNGDKVHEARVEISPAAAGRIGVVDVPERVDPV